MRQQTVLIVDDEPDIRQIIGEILRDEGFNVEAAENATAAREKYRKNLPDLVLLDIWMPDTDGITLLKEWKNEKESVPVVMISGHGTVETAVEAVRVGAYDFLEKPLSTAKLLVTVERALESRQLKDENLLLRNRLEPASTLTGRSSVIENLRQQIAQIGPTESWVLISGEAGSGKGVVARALHRASTRSTAPFIEIHLASIPPGNIPLRLFGLEQNGLVQSGCLDDANHGTLILDEIGDLDLDSQAKLLSALEENYFYRIDGNKPIEFDLRVISVTNQNLEDKISNGQFREDLFYRLAAVPITVPSLRQHREDIPELVDYYTKIIVDSEHLPFRHFSTATVNLLRNQEWPGNVRELRNLVHRLLITTRGEDIDIEETQRALDAVYKSSTSETSLQSLTEGYELPLRKAREQFERGYFIHHLKQANGNMTELAERSGMERTHLYRKLKSLEIDPKVIKSKHKNISG